MGKEDLATTYFREMLKILEDFGFISIDRKKDIIKITRKGRKYVKDGCRSLDEKVQRFFDKHPDLDRELHACEVVLRLGESEE